jgi:hypothetical protein
VRTFFLPRKLLLAIFPIILPVFFFVDYGSAAVAKCFVFIAYSLSLVAGLDQDPGPFRQTTDRQVKNWT